MLGVPAILAGLGAGLERATYSNAKELREFFTEQKLIPMWNHFANEFTKQLLLQDFEDNKAFCFKYDLSDVRALSQDEDATMQRIVTGFNAGFVTVNEARQANQLPALDNGLLCKRYDYCRSSCRWLRSNYVSWHRVCSI